MKTLKKIFKIFAFGITLISISLLILGQIRSFYQVGDFTFTVWKNLGGTCYIMPYKYYGIFPPKKNFITTPNLGGITICIDKGTHNFTIFGEGFEHFGETTICLPDYTYNYIKDPYNGSMKEIDTYHDIRGKYFDSLSYEVFLKIYIAEMNAIIKENRSQ